MWSESAWERHIVALDREVVKACGIAVPAGHVAFFAANYMSRRDHLHAAASQRALHKSHLQFDCGANRDLTRSQEEYPCRTDVARHQHYRNCLRRLADSRESQRKRKRSARVPAPFAGHSHGVGRHARKVAARSGLARLRRDAYTSVFKFTPRRRRDLLPVPTRSSPHMTPSPVPSPDPSGGTNMSCAPNTVNAAGR